MMGSSAPDILVLRKGTHGLSTQPYAEALRKRLPEYTIRRASTPQEEQELIKHTRIATGVEISEQLLSHAEDLQLFACAFAGVDHLPMEALQERNVSVTNASGIHATNIAEQILGYILTFSRRLHEGWMRNENNEWRHYKSYDLTDSTVTIVGLGAIGQEAVQRLQGFETHTIGVRYSPEKGGPTDEVIGFEHADLHAALAETDYLVLACPLTETTEGLIGEEEFVTLPPEAVLVNIARGPIVNTGALVSALEKEQIRGAALDVTDPEPLPSDHKLWTLENALITPHNGGHTPKHWDRLADILARNVQEIQKTKEYHDLENQVLAPRP